MLYKKIYGEKKKMNCTKHSEKEAQGACVYCGKFFCEDCLVEVEGKNYCRDCVSKAFAEKGANNDSKNIVINNNNSTSSSASASASATAMNMGAGFGRGISPKSKSTTLMLSLLGFVAFAGIHRLYVGKIGSGILYLCTGGLCGIGTILDIIKIMSGTFTDGNGLPIVQ